MKKNNYTGLTKEELITKIRALEKRKKYGLVWEEKPEDVVELCKTKLPVLKEVKSKAIDGDSSKPVNLLIEGDNYHALSVLNYTHEGKIDFIYIDPPYNTGNNDFIYNDKYVDYEDSYRHSKWLAFMSFRLTLAKKLLSSKGLIFISIDDNEQAQLKLICDEIFKEKNFIANYIWESRSGKGATSKLVVNQHEYILCYAKNIEKVSLRKDIRESIGGNYSDAKGNYRREQLRQWGQGDRKEDRPTMYYPVIGPDGKNIYPKKEDGTLGRWRISKLKMAKLIAQKDVDFVLVDKKYRLYRKVREGNITKTAIGTFLLGLGTASNGTIELKKLFKDKVFDTTKPLGLIKHLIGLNENKKAIVLDFMAGSGTTGHAVLELNKKDNAERQFILCTNNENGIAESVCYPRIVKAIKGYNETDGKKIAGLKGNLKYYKTYFVDAEPTDGNKRKLTLQAIEMLCVKEGTYDLIIANKKYSIYKSGKHYTGIIFDQDAIETFKDNIKEIKGDFNIYVFSLGDDTFDEEFIDLKQKVKVKPIPESIMRVYRRIFK